VPPVPPAPLPPPGGDPPVVEVTALPLGPPPGKTELDAPLVRRACRAKTATRRSRTAATAPIKTLRLRRDEFAGGIRPGLAGDAATLCCLVMARGGGAVRGGERGGGDGGVGT
jgi:hypothetical protein